MTETSNGDSNKSKRGLFDIADMMRECAAMLEQNEFEPSLFEKTILELTKYSSTKGSEPAAPTSSEFPAPAVVKQEDFSNKTYMFVSKLGKSMGVDIGHVAQKNDKEKAATSAKNAHRAKEDLAEASGTERDNWSTASQGSRDTVAKKASIQTRPPFQRPVNPNSSLIANGWLEQHRRSKMRTVWKEVLVSLVAGRRPGEETTLWVQRENHNQLTGKSELEALHQIPIRGLKEVNYVDYSSDHRFVLEVYNMTEDYTFRTKSAEAAKNWVATLRMTKELVLEGKTVVGRAPVQISPTADTNHNTGMSQHSAVKVASLHEDSSVQTPVNENDSEKNELSLKPPKRKTVSELRALAHGAGINTHGMERGELELVVAKIQSNGVPNNVPKPKPAPPNVPRVKPAPPSRSTSNVGPHDENEMTLKDSKDEEVRKMVEEDAKVRLKQEEEARRKAAKEEEARRRAVAEEEARKRAAAEEEARKRAAAEEEARKRAAAEEEARRRAEEEARRRAEEEARRRAAAEEARRRAEEEARRRAEEEARRRAEEEARRRAHEEHMRRVAEERRREEMLRQQQAQWQKQQQQWQMQEEQRRQYEAAEQRRRQEEAMRQQQQWQQWQQQQRQQQPQQQRPPNFAQPGQPHPQFRPQGSQPPPPQGAGFPGQAPHGQHQQNGAGTPGNSAVNQKYAKMANEDEVGKAVIASIKHNILVQWALQPPSMQVLRPVEVLVSTIHNIFPPAGGVPGHDHFKKWKPFALSDLTENNRPDDDKLKRARRKLFLVLHPDKLPKDLNEEQAFVCKMLWDITSDAWNEHESRKNDLDWLN